jgi:hypothetical protein
VLNILILELGIQNILKNRIYCLLNFVCKMFFKILINSNYWLIHITDLFFHNFSITSLVPMIQEALLYTVIYIKLFFSIKIHVSLTREKQGNINKILLMRVLEVSWGNFILTYIGFNWQLDNR